MLLWCLMKLQFSQHMLQFSLWDSFCSRITCFIRQRNEWAKEVNEVNYRKHSFARKPGQQQRPRKLGAQITTLFFSPIPFKTSSWYHLSVTKSRHLWYVPIKFVKADTHVKGRERCVTGWAGGKSPAEDDILSDSRGLHTGEVKRRQKHRNKL